MSAPQPPGGREPEAFPTALPLDASTGAVASHVEWIEPVFGTDVAAQEEQRQKEGIPREGDALDAAPAREPGDAIAARVNPETPTPNSIPRPARSRRGRRSTVSRHLAPGTAARSAKWQIRGPGRHWPASAKRAQTVAPPATVAAQSTIAVTHTNRFNEGLGAEAEAAASALAALHGALAAGALAALHETLAAERELAIARIMRLGAERAAAVAEIAPPPGSAVARATRVQEVPDAVSIWTVISLLWRRDSGSRRPVREGAGSAVILAPGAPYYFHRTGTELAAWRGPETTAPAKSSRRLVLNAFALLVATVGVVTYYGSDIWSASARQTPSGAASTAVQAAAPAAPPARDPAQRIAYFRERAESGDAGAQYALGVLYAQGEGVAQNYASAASWFRKAASGGIVNAQDLAALYERGLTTPHDFVVAAYWYRNAAERGVEAAMAMLALFYERGEGVEASPVDAYAWYRAAARRGDTVAGKHAAILFEKFDGAEKGRAVVRAAEIVDALHEPHGAPSGSAALIPGDWIGRTGNRDDASTN